MKWKLIIACGLVCFIAAQSFIAEPTRQLLPKLSDYPVFEGRPSDLLPAKGFVRYELATTLFTDYAEKERLVKVPAGTSIVVTGDGLPQFPDGTMLVKTFFYWNDKRDTSRGRRIIETRVLVRSGDGWLAGTYLWNAEQNEAMLSGGGSRTPFSWIDGSGSAHTIRYQVPSARQCATCHRSGKDIVPIGFKTRNLNMDVLRVAAANGQADAPVNQLRYLAEKGVLAPLVPASFSRLPVWNDGAFTLGERARAYLEVNCAHCHNDNGFCSQSKFRPAYERPLDETGIPKKKEKILDFIRSGRMPLLGTTVVHQEGLQLLEAYFKTVNNEK